MKKQFRHGRQKPDRNWRTRCMYTSDDLRNLLRHWLSSPYVRISHAGWYRHIAAEFSIKLFAKMNTRTMIILWENTVCLKIFKNDFVMIRENMLKMYTWISNSIWVKTLWATFASLKSPPYAHVLVVGLWLTNALLFLFKLSHIFQNCDINSWT